MNTEMRYIFHWIVSNESISGEGEEYRLFLSTSLASSTQLSFSASTQHTTIRMTIVHCCWYLYRKVYVHFPNYNPIIVHSSTIVCKAIENSSGVYFKYAKKKISMPFSISELRDIEGGGEGVEVGVKLMISIIIIDLYSER